MKNITQIIWIVLLIVCDVNAQQEKGIIGSSNWLNNWTEFKPNIVDYGEANQILAGSISINTKLLKRNIYVLQGDVYVTNNAVLTIEPGTKIIGDFQSKGALIITKGATLIADGLETDPIVFTSNASTKKAGDWGGIIILGDAPINKFGNYSSLNLELDPNFNTYGGTNSVGSSGIIRYVRIEFAGKRIKGNDNFSGLLLAGLGSKTIIENVMVSYCGGNSFDIFGGELNLNKMVSLRSKKDDFKFTQGTQCRIDNSLAIRSSYVSSDSDSRCVEVLGYERKEETDFSKKATVVTATNLTMVNDSENLRADIQAGLIKSAVYIGENASLLFKRSVISGFNPAVLLDSNIEINDKNLKKMQFEAMYFNNCNGNIFTENNTNNEDLESWYGQSVFFNVYSKGNNSETFIDFSNDKKPDYRLQLSKITASK